MPRNETLALDLPVYLLLTLASYLSVCLPLSIGALAPYSGGAVYATPPFSIGSRRF